jgi:hypothetical protein
MIFLSSKTDGDRQESPQYQGKTNVKETFRFAVGSVHGALLIELGRRPNPQGIVTKTKGAPGSTLNEGTDCAFNLQAYAPAR